MAVTVRLFARLKEIAGADELPRDLGTATTVGDVWQSLAAEWPDLAPYAASLSCAVNAQYARMHTAVSDGDEIAFLPPVSGG
ncbi:MAG TPA: molybdopterin converting factor subunit 1 [Luteitalea sp.]|nr:molybdopterin converting factor subunit 1 [Luteitalea sp.]